MNLEYKFQVNFPNHNLPKILSRVQNKITEISKSFSTLTLYVQKLKVANAHINTLRTGDADLRFYVTTVQDK